MIKPSSDIEVVALKLCEACKAYGLHVWYRSKTTSSVYLAFGDKNFGTITIRNHVHRARLARWNVIIGYQGPAWAVEDGRMKRCYSETELTALVKDIARRAKKLGRRQRGKRT